MPNVPCLCTVTRQDNDSSPTWFIAIYGNVLSKERKLPGYLEP